MFKILVIVVILAFIAVPAFAQTPDTVGVVDTLRVGNINAYPGSQICLPLYAINDEHLGALVMPLEFSSPDIKCDSISFVGTRAASATMKSDSTSRENDIQNDARRVITWAVWFAGDLTPGNGVVANLWFTVDSSALPQIVEFDTFSTSEPPVYLNFTYTWAVDMIPAFVKGTINIEELNIPPQIQPIGEQYVDEGDTLLINIYAEDPEGDTVIFSLTNSPDGASFEDSGNGSAVFLWIPPYTGPWSSENSPYTVTFLASDGDTASAEDVVINVIDKIPDSLNYVLEIGADTNLYAEAISVPIKLMNPDSVIAMNLLIHYDQTALSLLNISRLNTRIASWEFFQSRINQPGQGDITILALADIPDPTLTPPLPPGKGTLVNLIFQIILDPCPLNVSTNIRYKFVDSTSNTLSTAPDHQFVGQNDIEYIDGFVLIQCPNDVGEEEESSNLPKSYKLFQNYPNPFNPKTDIDFTLHRESEVSLVIYNIQGQVIKRLVEDKLKAGRYKVTWKGEDLSGNRVASGVYFYRLKVGNYSETKRMIMVK